MERKNDSTILLLVAAGLGIYWYINNKKKPTDNISTQPVTPQPVSQEPISSMNTVLEFTEIKKSPLSKEIVEYTPVTDMFNSSMVYNYDNKNVDNAVSNMNIAPIE
jgi:uncharacterized surface anchored protein